MFIMGDMAILILGNGLSRLSFDERIHAWEGEVWGCNRIYLDYGAVLSGIAGHDDVMVEAARARDANGYQYRIMGTDEDPYTCRPIFRKDTGSTLVAEALTRGESVEVCGFDLGGLDVYSPGHEKKNKSSWVQRWRLILSEFGADRVTFWGHDHKPFILSNRPAVEYYRAYTKGKPHIAGDEYDEIVKGWKNDYSRVYDALPSVLLKNIGRRDWKLAELDGILSTGDCAKLPEPLAQKYVDLYRKDFAILPLPTVETL